MKLHIVPGAGRSSMSDELEAWLATLKLHPHQRPIAELARTIARRLDDPDTFTAAAADQFRRTLTQLVPNDALKHQAQTNSAKIKRASARPAKVGDAKKPGKKNPRARARPDDANARVQAPSVAERIRGRGARAD